MRHVAFFSFIICCVHLSSASTIRGLDPALAHLYTGTDGKFTCLETSKEIPFSRVNDDYCDCLNGSDEPGTSACHNGKFFCTNKGNESSSLSSSFVDDGICDCCDGSDEAVVKCKNTCGGAAESLGTEIKEGFTQLELDGGLSGDVALKSLENLEGGAAKRRPAGGPLAEGPLQVFTTQLSHPVEDVVGFQHVHSQEPSLIKEGDTSKMSDAQAVVVDVEELTLPPTQKQQEVIELQHETEAQQTQ
eukprot:gene1676-33070_t